MTDRSELPEGIGPHEGRELELLLSGKKPLAMFSEVIPSAYSWPDEQFTPYVAAGKLVMREFLTDTLDGKHKVRHLYYALPDEEWRIEEAHKLSLMHFDGWCDGAADVCAQLGRLLGYAETDIQTFIVWSEKMRATQTQ